MSAALLAAAVLAAAPQDGAQDGTDAAAPDAAMMEAWMEAAAPGPGHEPIKAMAGAWNVDNTIYMAPGAPPLNSKGTQTERVDPRRPLAERQVRGHVHGAAVRGAVAVRV